MKKKLAIAILDWGNGHLSRSCALIKAKAFEADYEIFFFVTPSQWQFINSLSWYTKIHYIEFSGYDIWLKPNGGLWQYLVQVFKLRRVIRQEHKQLMTYAKTTSFDLILSDHRYGFYLNSVSSIFLTHQINLATPWGLSWVNSLHHKLLSSFNDIWCFDQSYPKYFLGGKLSRNSNRNLKVNYVGHFSHMSLYDSITPEKVNSKQILVILSGPEPQRSYFENELFTQLQPFKEAFDFIFVNSMHQGKVNGFTCMNRKTTMELKALFLSSSAVISRMGYSTLMDLKLGNKRAILIPTPHQYEQLYLAKIHRNDELFTVLSSAKDITDQHLRWALNEKRP